MIPIHFEGLVRRSFVRVAMLIACGAKKNGIKDTVLGVKRLVRRTQGDSVLSFRGDFRGSGAAALRF